MRLVKVAAVVAGVVVVGLSAAAFLVWSRAKTSTVGDLEFANRLAIPPLAEPDVDLDGRLVFDLQLQRGEAEILPGAATEAWGANSSHLAPTLRASRGDEVMPRVLNGLGEETTTIHLPRPMPVRSAASSSRDRGRSTGARWR
jgi:suppressor of ftsI